MQKCLNNFQLKLIGLFTMTIDHIGLLWQILSFRIIGRISFPIFAFLISEGAIHTKNIYKYFYRLFTFAIIIEIACQIINNYFKINLGISRNIFFTLSFGLLAIIIYKSNLNRYLKLILFISLLFISYYFNFDYKIYGIIIVLIYYISYEKPLLIILSLLVINLIYCFLTNEPAQMYSLLSIPFILLYNNQKGKNMKYIFYLYYPLHLVALYIIHILIK